MKYAINFLKNQPMICAVFALVVSLMSILSLNSESMAGHLVQRLLLSGTCAVFLYMISGEKAVQDYFGSTGYVIKNFICILDNSGNIRYIIACRRYQRS